MVSRVYNISDVMAIGIYRVLILPSIGFLLSEILPPLFILSITEEICFLRRVVSLALFKLIGVAP